MSRLFSWDPKFLLILTLQSFSPSLGHRSVNKIFHDTTTVRALVLSNTFQEVSSTQTCKRPKRWQTVASVSRIPGKEMKFAIQDISNFSLISFKRLRDMKSRWAWRDEKDKRGTRFLSISHVDFPLCFTDPGKYRSVVLIDRKPIKIQYVSVNADERRLPWLFYYLLVHDLYEKSVSSLLASVWCMAKFLSMTFNTDHNYFRLNSFIIWIITLLLFLSILNI